MNKKPSSKFMKCGSCTIACIIYHRLLEKEGDNYDIFFSYSARIRLSGKKSVK